MDKIRLGHGSGGKMMHELIAEHFAPAFSMSGFGDSAVVSVETGRLAFTTDSYVVSPLFFPGGNIGELAVFGTVNDLAMAGAMPLYLSSGFIIEEGFPFSDLKRIVSAMSEAAEGAGVRIVAGDTKVVNRGKGDGIFINTAGIGIIADDIDISPSRIRSGDKVIVSGGLGNHGIAIIAERNGITFNPPVRSDTRPLNGIVGSMLGITHEIRFMRDPTRGGLATTLKEAAKESGKCIRIREDALPIPPQVRGACELLGYDPLYVANEGILVAIADPRDAEPLVSKMREHPYGSDTRIIGEVEDSPEGMVLLQTVIGGNRILEMLQGEQLPRIC
ncbi:MAG TPA: hydrogenase expression/formation protein HypE [Thermodesulfovibrionales bacterium]|nr:hydrogenase expression/formation protein HypE [Thermodesulfovibrionales bacterium]